jgi:hypothetical protein
LTDLKASQILRQTLVELRSEIGNAKRHKLVGSTPKILDNGFLGNFSSHL